jgi:hypothetical protein
VGLDAAALNVAIFDRSATHGVRHSISSDQFTLDRKPARTVRLWLSASMR